MNWNRIESRQNSIVKLCASLSEKKARERAGFFVAEGTTLLYDLCEKKIFPNKILISEKAEHLQVPVEQQLAGAPCEGYLVSEMAFEKVTTEKGSEGVVSLFSLAKLREALPVRQYQHLVALENVQDPGNVGTIMRSAAAFGFDAVLMTGCADPFGPKAIRASMGAIATLPVLNFPTTASMMDQLEDWGVHTVAACLQADSVPVENTRLASPVCVLIGNEGKGLSGEAIARSQEKSIIPILRMESLNAAAAATVFLWEICRRGGSHEG